MFHQCPSVKNILEYLAVVRRKFNAMLRGTCSFHPVLNCSSKRRASLREEDAVVIGESKTCFNLSKLSWPRVTAIARARRRAWCKNSSNYRATLRLETMINECKDFQLGTLFNSLMGRYSNLHTHAGSSPTCKGHCACGTYGKSLHPVVLCLVMPTTEDACA